MPTRLILGSIHKCVWRVVGYPIHGVQHSRQGMLVLLRKQQESRICSVSDAEASKDVAVPVDLRALL
jgi:hypothetical protein